jgi:hypothetical protein
VSEPEAPQPAATVNDDRDQVARQTRLMMESIYGEGETLVMVAWMNRTEQVLKVVSNVPKKSQQLALLRGAVAIVARLPSDHVDTEKLDA